MNSRDFNMKTLEQYIEQYGLVDGPKKFKNCQQSKAYHKIRYATDPEFRAKKLSQYRNNPEQAELNRKRILKYRLKEYYEGNDVYAKPMVRANMKSHKRKYNYCEICGCKENLECHHIIPITLENYEIYREDPNIITVCKDCHHDIHHGELQIPEELTIKLDNYLKEYEVKEILDESNKT